MKNTVIQYTTKEAARAENASLIKDVFSELNLVAPNDLGYMVIELEGGRFIHIVTTSEEGSSKALTDLPAFKRFQDGAELRMDGSPSRAIGKHLGRFGLLANAENS